MRYADWEDRLLAVLEGASAMPFIWGRHDCGLLVSDCILAMTGHDPAAGLRGRYSTAEEARALAGEQPGPAELLLVRNSGYAEIPPAQARRGDACLLEIPGGGLVMGLVMGLRLASTGRHGLALLPRSRMRRAWRVD